MDNQDNNKPTTQPYLLQPAQVPNGFITPLMLAATPTLATGDLYYSNGSAFQRLPAGANSQVLTLANGVPAWQTPATTTVSLTSYTAVMTGGANQAITTTPTDITGCTVTLAVAGTYLIVCNVGLAQNATGTGTPASVYLVVNGSTNATSLALYDNSTSMGADFQVNVSGQWIVTTTGVNQIAKLQVNKAFNTGTYQVVIGCTQISAVKIA